MVITYRPLKNNAVVRRLPKETSSGILILPDSELRIERNLKCEVLAVGPGHWKVDHWVPLSAKPGDIVLVRQWSGKKLEQLDENILVVEDDLIEGIYE